MDSVQLLRCGLENLQENLGKIFLGFMWRIYKFLYIIARARSVNIVLKCAQKFRKTEA